MLEVTNYLALQSEIFAAQDLTPDEVRQGCQDLRIIIEALAANPRQTLAVTRLADRVLHESLDQPEFHSVLRAVFGEGAKAVHDPECWGTKQYETAWRATRDAFRLNGLELSEDPAAPRDDGREGEICALTIACHQH